MRDWSSEITTAMDARLKKPESFLQNTTVANTMKNKEIKNRAEE